MFTELNFAAIRSEMAKLSIFFMQFKENVLIQKLSQ